MAGYGIPGVISDQIFGPPPDDYEQPEAAPELRAACDWFKSFMRDGEWHQRRIEAAKRYYKAASREIDAEDDGKFYVQKDAFGWYLFLCEALLEHPWNYDPTFGSRVVPLFAAIGRNLALLLKVRGVETRVRDLVNKNRGQPNGCLFELLVAASYARSGGRVTFRQEKPGEARSHDMDVTIRGKVWAVECKRMETSDYGDRERMRMRDLWKDACHLLVGIRRSVITNVEFHVEINEVEPGYLTMRTIEFLRSGQTTYIWYDDTASGSIGDIDLRPLQTLLKTDSVLATGSKMQALLLGRYVPRSRMIWALRARSEGSPRYIDECSLAVALNWQCTADASISAKARPITTHLAKAVTQLPKGVPAIVHVAFESVDGDDVEIARHAKILNTVRGFDPGDANVEYVYCHYLAPESPPDELFAYDETVQWLPLRPKSLRPLEVGEIVGTADVPWRAGRHWEPL